MAWEELTLEEQVEVRRVWHEIHIIAGENRKTPNVLEMRRVGLGHLGKTEISPTPHEGKPESKPLCSTQDTFSKKSFASPYDI